MLKAEVEAILKDSYSSIPIPKFTAYPNLTDAINTSLEGCFSSNFVQKSQKLLLLNGYENFYAPYEEVYPTLVSYNTTAGALTEISRVWCRLNTGLSNTVTSPDPDLPYGATSTYESTPPATPFAPHTFKIEVHPYDSNGVFASTPSIAFDMSVLDPQFYGTTIAYNGLAGVSNDGRYLVATYATGVGIPGVITGQKLEILRISDDLTTLTSVAKIDTTPTLKSGYFSFPQGVIMWRTNKNSDIYNLISAENSWNLSNPVGVTAQMVYYTFNALTGEFVRHAQSWVNQYIQGFDVDKKHGRVYAVTNGVSTDSVSVNQVARAPYVNDAVDKDYAFRAWKLDEDAHTLQYTGGMRLNSDGTQVRTSNNGKILAITSAPTLANDLFPSAGVALSPISRRYAPNVLNIYKVLGDDKIDLQQSLAAPPLSFGLAFNVDGDRLAVTGQPSYEQLGDVVGQKDTQLYDLIE